MARHEKFIPFIKSQEGGYVNHPLDKGGETNKGITIGAWKTAGFDTTAKISQVTERHWNGKSITYRNVTKSLYEMTDQQWEQVYKKQYWDAVGGDQINSQSVANILVDWAWASGPAVAVKNVQRLVGTAPDGVMGPKTIAAINAQNPQQLFDQIRTARVIFINQIVARNPQYPKNFETAWKRRLNEIKFED